AEGGLDSRPGPADGPAHVRIASMRALESLEDQVRNDSGSASAGRRVSLLGVAIACALLSAPPSSAGIPLVVDRDGNFLQGDRIVIELGQSPFGSDPSSTSDESDLTGVIVGALTSELVAQLDSPDYAQREAVAAELMGPGVELLELRALLARANL